MIHPPAPPIKHPPAPVCGGRRLRFPAALSAWGLLSLPLLGFTPVLNRVDPPGGQAGTVVDVTFSGERLNGVSGAVFHEPGLTLSDLAHKDGKQATARISIAPDAAFGEHSLRLTGPGGISELRSFWVGPFPTTGESEPNNSTGAPQKIELNRTVHGVAGNEDDDCYAVVLKKGQRLSAEAEAMRLGRTMFDVSLAILDSRGFELATCDDAPLLRTDAFVSILAPEDGEYRVLVREAAYEGNDQCQYRLHIGTFPRPKAVFPTGGKPGETIEFTFTGDPAGDIRQSVTLPADASGEFPLFPVHDGQSAPSPHRITVSPLESVRDNPASATRESAVAMPPPPSAAHGIIESGNPDDWLKFTATKDRALTLRAIARARRSPLDPVLSIHAADGKQLAANDDQGGPDSMIAWSCPADGDYFIRVRDQLGRSGPDFTWRVEVADRSPSISANLPAIDRVNSQKWKTFPVPRGNRYAAVVNLVRENIACDAVFEAASLPPGVTLRAPRIPRAVNSFPIVLEAAPDAPEGCGLHAFRIRSEGTQPAVSGNLTDTIHHVEINNQGAYHSVVLDRIATAVTREAPFKIDLESPGVPVVRNGTLGLKIRATRSQGFSNKITLRFLWNPPGISGPVTVDIPGDRNEADYEIHASGDAATGDWPVCILAEADTPDGPVLVSSALVTLKVAEPYLSIALDLAAAEPGKPTAITGKVEHLRPFTGTCQVTLSGLPAGVTCAPAPLNPGQTEISFPAQVAADTRTGKHSGLFCIAQVPENHSTIPHQTAMGGTLRIDPPAAPNPAPSAAKPAATAEKPAGEAPKKPLSRLEQLRQKK